MYLFYVHVGVSAFPEIFSGSQKISCGVQENFLGMGGDDSIEWLILINALL